MSFGANTVAKVENSTTPKISRMSIFSGLRRCNALWNRYGGCGRFCVKRCGPSRRRMNNAPAVLKKFVRQSNKDFFNTICHKQTSLKVPQRRLLANLSTRRSIARRKYSRLCTQIAVQVSNNSELPTNRAGLARPPRRTVTFNRKPIASRTLKTVLKFGPVGPPEKAR